MISKLQKLEAKLHVVDIEDLYTLTIYSPDITFIKHLQKFNVQYSEFYNVNEIFKDSQTKRQSFISVLIQKLYEITQWLRVQVLERDSEDGSRYSSRDFFIKRKVIYNICETLRICFRETIDFLTLLQHCQLFTSLTFIATQRYDIFIDTQKTVLSAYRVLVNALNKSPERILVFLLRHEQLTHAPFTMLVDANPLASLTRLMYNRINSATEARLKRLARASTSAAEVLHAAVSEEKSDVRDSASSKTATPSKAEGKEWSKEVPSTASERAEGKGGDEDKLSPSEAKERRRREEKEDDQTSQSLSDDVIEMILEDLEVSPSSTSTLLTYDVQILNYVVKILYMICCQSEEAREILKKKTDVIRALMYRLSRCLIDDRHLIQVTSSSSEEVARHICAPPYSSPSSSNSKAAVTSVRMIDFPYSQDNYLLFSTTCRLLYLLDLYTTLSHTSSPLMLTIDADVVDFFSADHVENHNKKRDEIESIDDIHVIVRVKSNNSINLSLRSAYSNENSVHLTSAAYDRYSLPALHLLHFVMLVVLTIAPYNWSLYITDAHQENVTATPMFYTGNLIHCEEVVLQLMMLAPDDVIQSLFHPIGVSQSSRVWLSGNVRANVTSITAAEMVDHIIAHRLLFLSNSLIRVLIIFLQRCKTKNLDMSEKAALLTPVIISMIKVLKADDRSFQIIKRLVFPNPYPPPAHLKDDVVTVSATSERMTSSPSTRGLFQSSSSVSQSQSQSMHPHDCPENSLRHALIQLMTSLDTNIKRCVAECLYLLCSENKDEFVYRTGFGNSVALLQIKGVF